MPIGGYLLGPGRDDLSKANPERRVGFSGTGFSGQIKQALWQILPLAIITPFTIKT